MNDVQVVKTKTSPTTWFVFVIIVVVVAMTAFTVGNAINNNEQPVAVQQHQESQTATATNKQLSSADKTFVAAALNYFGPMNQSGMRLATVWANAPSGISTLEECYSAARTARNEETELYAAYRKHRGSVSAAFKPVDQNILAIHAKVTTGLKNVLSARASGDMNALQLGIGQYKDAIQMTNSAVAQGTQIMEDAAK